MVATYKLATAEMVAKGASAGLAVSIKGVGAAIKAVPGVGWALAIVAAILVLLNVLFALMMKPSKKRGKKNSLGKTFAKLLSVLMFNKSLLLFYLQD